MTKPYNNWHTQFENLVVVAKLQGLELTVTNDERPKFHIDYDEELGAMLSTTNLDKIENFLTLNF